MRTNRTVPALLSLPSSKPILLTAAVVALLPLLATATTCPLSTVNPSVTICAPTSNANSPAPVHVVAGTTDSQKVTQITVLIDGKQAASVKASAVNTWVPVGIGPHTLTVQAVDSAGRSFHSEIKFMHAPPCALGSANPSITICTPTTGAVLTVPVHLVAAANDSSGVTAMHLYLDGVSRYQSNNGYLDVYLSPLTSGSHTLTVSASDAAGKAYSRSIRVAASNQPDLSKLRHIIFLLQENRSFDHYFGMMGQYRAARGYTDPFDGIPLSAELPTATTQLIKPFHQRTVCHENLSPSWYQGHHDFDGGRNDDFLLMAMASTIDPLGTRAIGYYDWSDLPYYHDLAFQFATSDRFFASTLTSTIPNRMYMFAGTSFGHVLPDSPPSGGWTQPTIFAALDQAGISWHMYYHDPDHIFLTGWSIWSKDFKKVTPLGNSTDPLANWRAALQNESTLPQVIFIERGGTPGAGTDEHPGANIQVGAADTANLINTLMRSPSWASSVFILAYDESGGLYDHVSPAWMVKPDNIAPMIGGPPGDFSQTGFRVPITVVSPWTRPHFVSHTWRDLTSILRLIELRFDVPPLTARDAAADGMVEFFDFAYPYWLTPPSLPSQPTDGTCNYGLEVGP